MDVIASDFPLLISKKAMSKAKVKLDLASDTITWREAEVRSVPTSTGHLCVSLLTKESEAEIVNVGEEEQGVLLSRYTILLQGTEYTN